MVTAANAVSPSGAPRTSGPVPVTLKASATSATSSGAETHSPVGDSKPQSPVRGASPARGQRRPPRTTPADFLSDKTTAALIRRTLCAQHLVDRGRSAPAPIEELLPPLTSRNDVDLQLYALISIILREFVQNWYSKITPDETFVAEIVQIIAHSTRGLEQRLRKVDLESLLFDELPELFDAHVQAYRIATNSSSQPPIRANPRDVYHSLLPLPALSPVPHAHDTTSVEAQVENEAAYRQLLVQGFLALLLPTEDLQNECLTALVGQIFSELIVGNLVIDKLSQPWLIWEVLIILTRLVHGKGGTLKPGGQAETSPDESSTLTAGLKRTKHGWSVTRLFWSLIQWGFLIVNLVRLMISTALLSRTLPSRSVVNLTPQQSGMTSRDDEKTYAPLNYSETGPVPPIVPVVSYNIWSCMSNLFEIDARMPWLTGALSILQWGALRGPGKVAAPDNIIDRLLSHYIQTRILDPARLPPLLRSIRGAIFPNNTPGSSTLTAPSSDQELTALRRRCAKALWALVPRRVGILYYGSSPWPQSSTPPSTQDGEDLQGRSGPQPNSTLVVGAGDTASTAGEAAPPDLPTSQCAHKHYTASDKGDVTSTRVHWQVEPDKDESVRDDKLGAEKDPLSATVTPHSSEEDGDDEQDERALAEIESGILDIFSDPYCNKHLLYGFLELILVRLMPELAERGVIDLLDERLS